MDIQNRLFNIPNKLIAITGGICSGKSTYCKQLEEEGKEVFYADKIVKKIYKKKSAKALIGVILFDHVYNYDLDNEVDFKELRKRAFKFPEVLDELEKLVGEFFEGELLKEYVERGLNIPKCYGDFPNGFDGTLEWKDIYIEHPLVYKMNIQDSFDDIIMMEASEEVRLKRIIKRDGCSEETARQMIESQK